MYYLILCYESETAVAPDRVEGPLNKPNPETAVKHTGADDYDRLSVYELAVDEDDKPVLWSKQQLEL